MNDDIWVHDILVRVQYNTSTTCIIIMIDTTTDAILHLYSNTYIIQCRKLNMLIEKSLNKKWTLEETSNTERINYHWKRSLKITKL